MSTNAQVLFVSRPAKGKLDPAKVFNVSRKKSKPSASDLRDGEVLVRNVVLSFDAAMRAWMGELKTYREPLALGSVMDGQAVSVVVASKSPKFSPGDKVFCMSGWQEYTVFSDSSDVGKAAEKLPSEVSLLDAQYICGGTAVTAWFGLLEVGQFKKGETVVISGAGGATGSMVGQLARAMGAGRVIGIAGGPSKCSWLKKELGFDETVDYKVDRKTFTKAMGDALRGTKGIDVYFDNTGGMASEVCFNRLNLKARVVVCGNMSSYEGVGDPKVSIALGNLVPTRGRVEGFLVFDYQAEFTEARKKMIEMAKDGKLKVLHTTMEGIENAPMALAMLFDGKNTGKMQCRLCSDEDVARELGRAKL